MPLNCLYILKLGSIVKKHFISGSQQNDQLRIYPFHINDMSFLINLSANQFR